MSATGTVLNDDAAQTTLLLWTPADGSTGWTRTTNGVQETTFDANGMTMGPTLASGQQERCILAAGGFVAGEQYTIDVDF